MYARFFKCSLPECLMAVFNICLILELLAQALVTGCTYRCHHYNQKWLHFLTFVSGSTSAFPSTTRFSRWDWQTDTSACQPAICGAPLFIFFPWLWRPKVYASRRDSAGGRRSQPRSERGVQCKMLICNFSPLRCFWPKLCDIISFILYQTF